MQSHRKATWKYAIVSILFGLIIGAGSAELLVRAFAPAWLSTRMQQLNAGDQKSKTFGNDQGWPAEYRNGVFYRFRPKGTFWMRNYEYNVQVTIDDYGGRYSEAAGSNELNGRRVIPVLGDSFTFGVGVNDDETFVSIFNQEEVGGEKSIFINLGVPGSSLPAQVQIAKLRHEELGYPKVYIFAFFLGNDFEDIQSWQTEKGSKKQTVENVGTRRSLVDNALWKANAWLYHSPVTKHLYLLQFIKAKMLAVLNRNSLRYADAIFRIMARDIDYRRSVEAVLIEVLENLQLISNKLGFRPIVLVIPDRYQVDSDLRDDVSRYYSVRNDELEPRAPNDILGRALDEHGIEFVDPTDCLSAAPAGLYYVQDNHMTANGHRRYADCVRTPLKVLLSRRVEAK